MSALRPNIGRSDGLRFILKADSLFWLAELTTLTPVCQLNSNAIQANNRS
jgi:hypothetical protein